MSRPTWTDYFISLAILSSSRSHDTTKVGCVFVKDTMVLVTGYNGYAPDLDDEILPKTRPEKYPWMNHAEKSCLLACVKQGKSTINAKAYIFSCPCFACFYDMYSSGIKEIHYIDHPYIKMQLLTESKEWLSQSHQFEGKISLTKHNIDDLPLSKNIFLSLENSFFQVYNTIAET